MYLYFNTEMSDTSTAVWKKVHFVENDENQ